MGWRDIFQAVNPSEIPEISGPVESHFSDISDFSEAVQVEVQAPKASPVTVEEERFLRRWLRSIGETDPHMISALLDKCRRDIEARTYFLNLAKSIPYDDRITCEECANLVGSRCQAASRGEINAHRRYEPMRDMLRRCEGFKPLSSDADRRTGKERWPSLGHVRAH